MHECLILWNSSQIAVETKDRKLSHLEESNVMFLHVRDVK